ncbi:hypothetical protein SPRG_05465 [Saprolegnia parasitica CBS 223.65]|uniref:F-box domain-containing protein n=1 Tax=Saprolegnia parasitica (strain CBS 223.65) TaxID=695850 RepID=A0A067CG66_SAPPC|nr:hypothetical protein SPRG_05465 [Saprolegnia parasitica CBS 223.65]KDO29508.1 hypothetical protein SPRG_05465 [Saprolegnia parasitica CBS 223.65]|eukprot:XP_012199574.1 hypothetical protein SPRG_05465 [Saprolegnia parasitica CBS 223.65]
MLQLDAVVWHASLFEYLGCADWVRLASVSKTLQRVLATVPVSHIVALGAGRRLPAVVQARWPCLRLAVHLGPEAHDAITDTDAFACVHTLHITRCHRLAVVGPLPRLRRLHLDHCAGVEHLCALGDLEVLSVSSCPELHAPSPLPQTKTLVVTQCPQWTNFKAWTALEALTVEAHNAHAVVVLVPRQLRRLRLVHCTFAPADITAIPHVELEACLPSTLPRASDLVVKTTGPNNSRVVDVAPLAHLSAVDLSGSWCLDDVRPLARVHTLNLTDCTALTNVDALCAVDDLNLTNCYRISNVRALQSQRMYLVSVASHISMLDRVQHLDVTGLGRLTSVAGLAALKTLVLGGHRQLCLDAPLRHLRSIYITDCIQITSIDALRGVPTVHIDGCRQLVDVSPLALASDVSLRHCPLLTDVSCLRAVHTVDLRHCAQVTDIAALEDVNCLHLERIPFTSARGIHRVKRLTIDACWGFSNCHLLRPSVALYGCGCNIHSNR